MGIDVVYRKVSSTVPSIATVNSQWTDIDLIIIPRYTFLLKTPFARFVNFSGGTGVTICPVFSLSANFYDAAMYGASSAYDAGATFATSYHPNSGASVPTNARRMTQDASITAPAEVIPIVRGTGDDATAMTTWRYTPDGAMYVYHSTSEHRFCHLHLMMQDAIKMGIMDAPPHPAPLILNIDHINDGGEPAAVGGVGGWQENPQRIADVGAVLRQYGGICYTSIDARWIDGTLGTTTGDLLTNLKEYSDVFKICASHDHGNYYTTETNSADDPISNQQTKTNISTWHDSYVTATEGIGLSIDDTFIHMAGNRAGTNTWELATPDSSRLADPDETTAQTGWGTKMARLGLTVESWPSRSARNDTDKCERHWLFAPHRFRGITFVHSQDAGTDYNDDGTDAKVVRAKWNAFMPWLQAITTGLAPYFHAEDFEDVAWRTANLAGSPTTSSGGVAVEMYGLDVWTWLGKLGSYCSDTIDFGADVTKYLK
ncbi:MAG TPA: hypothetical protein VK971_02160 [Thiohalobacter sp.]|nr:hypothetical protein [Thiohalobacter sp.]